MSSPAISLTGQYPIIEKQLAALELQLANVTTEEEVLALTNKVIEAAAHSMDQLSDSQKIALTSALDEIDQELKQFAEPSLPEESKEQPSAPREKRTFWEKKLNQIRHASKKTAHGVRDAGRVVRSSCYSLKKRVSAIDSKAIATSVKNTAHKVGKFVKNHRKEILIGLAIAAVATGVIILAASSSTAAGVLAGGAGASLASNSETQQSSPPKNSTSSATTSRTSYNSTFTQITDGGRTQREAALIFADKIAKEQLYPDLKHSTQSVQMAQEKADRAFKQFEKDLVNNIDAGDVGAVISLVAKLRGKSKPLEKLGTTVLGVSLTERTCEKVVRLYQPTGEAYQTLHAMESANKQASLMKCQESNYKPQIEYTGDHFPNQTILTDKNNPNPNKIIIPFSDDEN